MERKRRLDLKNEIAKKFGTLTDGASEIGINFFRLSRFVSGAVQLRDDELTNLRQKLGLSKKEFFQII